MKLEELDYEINSDLIALRPKQPRDESKLLISENPLKIIRFKNIIEILNPGDILVINDTKVIRSDITGHLNKSKVSINLNKIIDVEKNLWSILSHDFLRIENPPNECSASGFVPSTSNSHSFNNFKIFSAVSSS